MVINPNAVVHMHTSVEVQVSEEAESQALTELVTAATTEPELVCGNACA